MARITRVELLHVGTGHHHLWMKPKKALELVQQGLAELVSESSIQMVKKYGHVVTKSHSLLKESNQSAAYELAAIDKNRKFVVGGLCRTEKRPSNIPKYTSAKVGHQ